MINKLYGRWFNVKDDVPWNYKGISDHPYAVIFNDGSLGFSYLYSVCGSYGFSHETKYQKVVFWALIPKTENLMFD